MTTTDQASIKRTARLAGGLYLALMPFGFFGTMYVPSVLVVPGDAATTARNIMASEGLFRSGMVSHLISQIIFIFLALALYRLLEPVNKRHAVLMVVLALPAAPIAFLNEVNHLAVLWLLPRLLGILLMVACCGYLIDSVVHVLFPNLDATISQFTFVGELLLPLWLLDDGNEDPRGSLAVMRAS